METISARELERYIGNGRVLVIDLRSDAEYARGHVPGAVNLQPEQLAAALRGSAYREVILYCARGARSMAAARELERRGFYAKSVVGGFRAYRGRIEAQRGKMTSYND